MSLDPVRFTRALVEKVKSALAPIEARLVVLEQREVVHGKDGRDGVDGKDAAPVDVDHLIGKVLAIVKDGKDGEPGPSGVDGKDGAPGRDGVDGKDGRDGVDGKDGAPGLNGKDVDPETVVKAVAAAIAAIPLPKDGIDGKPGKDGTSVTLDHIVPLVKAEVAQAVAAIPAAKDGSDGVDGEDGRDGLPGVPGLTGEKGLDGVDGKDGLGFDDVQVEHDGHGGFTLKFIRGDRSKTFGVFQVPRFEYHGVWTPKQYVTGDSVTWAGSLWIAKTMTSMKPGDGSDGWQLAVKRGADGKNGK